ncbi:uncharacterized protein C13orf42 [Sardina pilchardus]|uniref:uncharacterized protein C13orf42 n=1 Tax=Sardina pilchardus TaxID=27697 RepID=UPI002E0D9022
MAPPVHTETVRRRETEGLDYGCDRSRVPPLPFAGLYRMLQDRGQGSLLAMWKLSSCHQELWKDLIEAMFRKINAVFRPNHGHRGRCEDDYHSACTVKLVRSTSMLVVGEARGGARANRTRLEPDATLKRSKSSVTLESTSTTSTTSTSTTALYYYQSRQDQIWLYSQNQNCLQYLQELVALRRQYTQSIMNIHNAERRNSLASEAKKKVAPQPPRAKASQSARAEPTAPPIPNEEDTLQYLDSVIASCDPEPKRKPNMDDGNADVDFVVATSTSEHDLHSNWVLRDPRRFSMDESRLRHAEPKPEPGPGPPTTGRRKGQSGTTASARRLQRNPIHLPKVVESAFQTLRFKPKLKKKD